MTTLHTPVGTPMPDLKESGLGKAMPETTKHQAELARHIERQHALGRELLHLQEQIPRLERQHTEAWSESMRTLAYQEPPTTKLEEARERLEVVRREYAAAEMAAQTTYADLLQTVAEEREAGLAQVHKHAEKRLEKASEHFARGAAEMVQTDADVGAVSWLSSGGQFYSPPTPTSVSVEHLLDARKRELGIEEVEEVIVG